MSRILKHCFGYTATKLFHYEPNGDYTGGNENQIHRPLEWQLYRWMRNPVHQYLQLAWVKGKHSIRWN